MITERTRFLFFLAALILAGLLPVRSSSQTFVQSGLTGRGTLNVNHDDRLDELVRRHMIINREKEGMQGYRIRIFSRSGQAARPNATEARAVFFNKYPEIETYLVYDAPNFKVYVGDFRTRSEALKMQRMISRDYPYSFIVSDRINFPPLD